MLKRFCTVAIFIVALACPKDAFCAQNPNYDSVVLPGDSALAVMNGVESLAAAQGNGVLDSVRQTDVQFSPESGGFSVDFRDGSGHRAAATVHVAMVGVPSQTEVSSIPGDFAVALVLARRYIKAHGISVNTDSAYRVEMFYPWGVGNSHYRDHVGVEFQQHAPQPQPAPNGKFNLCEGDRSFSINDGVVQENPPMC